MKIGPLLENEQDRKDLLHWQQKLMDVFPDSYDVGLATRAPYTKGEAFNVVTVARNGKELFYFDTRSSSIDFFSTMGVCGDHVRHFSVGVTDLQKSVNVLMLMYELQRKISNLLSDAKCIIDKDRKKSETFVVEVQSKTKRDGQAVMVYYGVKQMTFSVSTEGGFNHKKDFGSTKDMNKALGLVEKAFKSLSE